VRFTATGAPGDTAQGRLTLEIIRDALLAIFKNREEDAKLYFLDGLDLYGPEDGVALPLPDGLHPNAEAHKLIGGRFADQVFGPGGPFGTP
jgi:lysophospholipase L1-like esterase